MEVGVRVEVEKNSLRLLICKAYLVFVPQQRPPEYRLRSLVPETDDETLKMALAQERKKIRVAVKGLVDRAVAKAEISASINTAPLERQLNLTLSTGLVVKDSGPTNDLVGKSPRMQSVQLVLPSHANHMNNTFGGQVMEWMVEGSIIAAMRHVKQRVRVQSIDHVYFVAPSTVGDRIHVKAQVNRSFGGSIEVGVRAEAINPSSGSTPVLICKMFACMTTIIVAPDGKVRMNDIPDVSPISIDEIRRWRAAKGRQQIRLERRALAESNSSSTKIAWAWSKYLTTQEFRYNNISSLLHLASTPKGYWQPIAYEDDHDKDNNKGIINIELKETTDDVTAVKLCTTIEASAISTFQFLKDVQNRKMWDQFFTDAEIRESIDEEDDILWLAMGDKDFCLLRSWTTNAPLDATNHSIEPTLRRSVIACHSVIHNSTPPNWNPSITFPKTNVEQQQQTSKVNSSSDGKDSHCHGRKPFIRSEVDSSGFIIEPIRLADGSYSTDLSKCSLTYIAQIGSNALGLIIGELYTDRATVKTISSSSTSTPDSLSRTSPLVASFRTLREVLAARYKSFKVEC
jgi:acyl-CoA hydrolase